MSKTRRTFTTDIKPEAGEKPVKIDKWDWNAVKNALDDATRKFLVSQSNFKEDHRLMNTKLIISTVAVLFSGVAMLYDWMNPFPKSRSIMLLCVVLYFITMGILTYYTTYIEKNCFLVVKELDEAGIDRPNVWRVYSKQKKYDENYILEVEYQSGTTNAKRNATFSVSVGEFFDTDGNLLANRLYTQLSQFFDKLSQDKKDK